MSTTSGEFSVISSEGGAGEGWWYMTDCGPASFQMSHGEQLLIWGSPSYVTGPAELHFVGFQSYGVIAVGSGLVTVWPDTCSDTSMLIHSTNDLTYSINCT